MNNFTHARTALGVSMLVAIVLLSGCAPATTTHALVGSSGPVGSSGIVLQYGRTYPAMQKVYEVDYTASVDKGLPAAAQALAARSLLAQVRPGQGALQIVIRAMFHFSALANNTLLAASLPASPPLPLRPYINPLWSAETKAAVLADYKAALRRARARDAAVLAQAHRLAARILALRAPVTNLGTDVSGAFLGASTIFAPGYTHQLVVVSDLTPVGTQSTGILRLPGVTVVLYLDCDTSFAACQQTRATWDARLRRAGARPVWRDYSVIALAD